MLQLIKRVFTKAISGYVVLMSNVGTPATHSPFSVPATSAQVRSELGKITRVQGNPTGNDAVLARCPRHFDTVEECTSLVDRAFTMGLITAGAVEVFKAEGFYPVITPNNNMDGFELASVCPCGCFEAQTRILSLRDGFAQWIAAKDIQSQKDKLLALDDETTLTQFKENPLAQFVPKKIEMKTAGEESLALFVFSLSNGQTLKVTDQHGMILSDGRVVPAKEIVQGQKFISVETGEDVVVQSINREVTQDLVYNYRVKSKTPAGTIIAAEGVLVGSHFLQEPENRKEAKGIALRQ